jgi:hypothetical protein
MGKKSHKRVGVACVIMYVCCSNQLCTQYLPLSRHIHATSLI